MTKSKYRGHDIEYRNKKWVYSDNKKSVNKTYESRNCGNCGTFPTKEGHDGCLRTLKGVRNACCGHGDIGEAYVQFLDESSIHGEDAILIMEILKRNRI